MCPAGGELLHALVPVGQDVVRRDQADDIEELEGARPALVPMVHALPTSAGSAYPRATSSVEAERGTARASSRAGIRPNTLMLHRT